MSGLSDKAVAVFAFAAYHQLESGEPVTTVIREDDKGHKGDEDAVAELERLNLAQPTGNDIVFTESGLSVLARAVEGLRGAGSAG